MSIPNSNEERARTNFSPSAWNQGAHYLVHEAVTAGTVQRTPRGIELTADVRRSAHRSYRVTIVCDETGACQGACTCPFETRGGCAHCAAVLMLWWRRPDLFVGAGLSPAAAANASDGVTAVTAVTPSGPHGKAVDSVATPVERLWVAVDGTICIDLAAAGVRSSQLRDTLGEHLATVPGQGCVELSALGLANALQQGVTVTRVLAALAEAADGIVPPVVVQQINRWAAAADNLHLYDSLCIIEFADDFILQELLRVSGLRHFLVHIFSPRVIVVQPKHIDALVADLEARGFMPRVEPV